MKILSNLTLHLPLPASLQTIQIMPSAYLKTNIPPKSFPTIPIRYILKRFFISLAVNLKISRILILSSHKYQLIIMLKTHNKTIKGKKSIQNRKQMFLSSMHVGKKLTRISSHKHRRQSSTRRTEIKTSFCLLDIKEFYRLLESTANFPCHLFLSRSK